ncbi:MAG: M48 family metallopeptidase [Puniceicoccales bacterium]|jgi:Zn-dependent protease with chaperone function|nr:M48 family metallopeptidase [Puniceicoccales bacterium]
MDFFEAQAYAKKRTGRLLLLFACAVLGISLAGYATSIFFLNFFQLRSSGENVDLWQSDVALFTLLATIMVVGLGSFVKWLGLREGGKAIAEMLGATRVNAFDPDLKKRQLLNVVEEMAIASGLPMPAVYLLGNESSINAFAAGLTIHDAVITVSQGALDHLSRDELQAVVGHEFSHILNGDMRLNIKLTATIFGILLFAIIGRGFLQTLRGSRSAKKGTILIVAAGLLLVMLGYIGYFFGRLIQAAVSRQREFLADASAVQFTRNPHAMASALNKIRMGRHGSTIRDEHAQEVCHLFFAQCFDGAFSDFFATHPPLEKRIKAIDAGFDLTAPLAPSPDKPKSPLPPSRISGRNLQDNTSFLASIGTVDSGKIEQAQILINQFSRSLHQAAQDPSQAVSLILALLLDENITIRSKQTAELRKNDPDGSTSLENILPLFNELEDINPPEKLPLFQIALGSLHSLSPEQQDLLLTQAQRLTLADDRTSIFEYALLRMLKHHIHSIRHPNQARRIKHHSHQEIATAISIVLSFVTYAGKSPKLRPSEIFSAGVRLFPSFAESLKLVPVIECNYGILDNALQTLGETSSNVIREVLNAATACASSDGVIQPNEAELIRAIAFSFDCPIPLFS